MKYRLGDLTIKNWNSWDNVPRQPQAVGTAILGALGITASATVSYIVGYVAVTAVTSWALKALTPKPDIGAGQSSGILVNSRSAAAPHDFVYGEIRKGGTVTFYEATGTNNRYLHQVIVLAGHEVNSIGDIYINDLVASIDGNNFVTTAGTGSDQVDYNSKIRIKKHDGSQTTADSDLVSETSVDSNFIGNGIAYLYVRYEYDQDVFPNGVPLITAKVQGKKVYDPRTATTGYSNNAALCIRDFITSSYGLNDSSIDDTSFQAAANECDESVTLSGSGTENRYTINGVVRADRAIGDVLQDMTTACAGTLFWGAGSWKLKAGAYSSPVKTLTLDDLRGPISLDTRISMRDNFNTISGTFIDADQDYITVDYPQLTSATFKAEDGGQEVVLDLPLPYTTSAATAQRLAKLTLFRGREQMTLSADFGLEAFEIEVGDIIAFTNARYGFSAKEFEVIGWKLASNQDAGDLRVNLTLRETSSAAFDWNAEESAITANNTTLPDFRTVSPPTSLTLTTTAVVNDDGITIPAIRADWTVSDDRFVHYYEVQFKRLGGSEDYGQINTSHSDQEDFGSIASATDETDEDYGLTNEPVLDADAEFVSVFTSTTSYLIQPVLNGYDYQVKVRSVSALDVRSTFATATLASEGDTTPPTQPLNLSAVGGSKYIEIVWTNPADQDLSHIEIWENTVDNLNTASLVGTSGSTNFFRGNLANNITRYYWARAVDLSLNKSAFTSSVNATTLLVTPNDFNDAVNDLFSEAGAFGIEPVNSLPASGDFDGQLVLLLSDITIYRWDNSSSSWSTDVFTASSVSAGDVTFASFASGIEPVSIVSSLPTVSGYTGPKVVLLTTDNKLYRLDGSAWTATVPTTDITGTLPSGLFSDDLRPVERVSALPSTALTQGRIVLLTTDNKLYRYTGNAWTSAVPTTDLTGQITGTQITDNAITTTKIAANAVTANEISAGAVTASEIAANAITTDKIATGAVSADEIAANAITSSKIAADAVTANAIAANSITSSELAADSVTAGAIAAGAVSASEIAADAIVTDKIASGAVVADSIATNAITAAKIGTDQVTANKIAASSIITSKIATGAVTAEKISVSELSAISADLGTIEVDTANIADGAISSAKIDDSIQSTNYSANTAGWKIQKSGDAEFNGVVISRQLLVDSGTQAVGNIGGTSSYTPVFTSTVWIKTNIDVSAWAGTNKTYLVAIGNTGSVTALTTDVTNNPTGILWGFRGLVLPLTQWSGTSKLWIQASGYIARVTSTNLTLQWKVYEVT